MSRRLEDRVTEPEDWTVGVSSESERPAYIFSHNDSARGLSASQKSQTSAMRTSRSPSNTKRQPKHPPRLRLDGSVAGGDGGSVVGGGGGSVDSSPFSLSSSLSSGFGHLSSPQGASAGPTANEVAPNVFTEKDSSGTPLTATPSADASTESGASGIVGSASTMSQSSPFPSVTATPSTSAISAPLLGPSTIFSRKFIVSSNSQTIKLHNLSLPNGWMLISALSSWNDRTGSS